MCLHFSPPLCFPQTPFLYFTHMNKILETAIQFKELVQDNLKKNLKKTSGKRNIFDRIWIALLHRMGFFKLYLFKNDTNKHEMSLQQFSALITNTSVILLCGLVDNLWKVFMLFFLLVTCLRKEKMYTHFIIFNAI